MSIRFLPLALLSLAGSAHASEECPASLVFHMPELAETEQAVAQEYASCVSVPWLPTADALSDKLAQCATHIGEQRSGALAGVIEWVDHIAAEFAGCETRLEIEAAA